MERTFSVFAIVIFPVVIRKLYGWVWGHIRARACVAMAYARNMDSSPRVNKRILGQIFLIISGKGCHDRCRGRRAFSHDSDCPDRFQ